MSGTDNLPERLRDIARRALEGLTLLCQRERAAAADRIHEIEELELEVHLRDRRIEALELDRNKHAAAAEIRDERWKVVTGERDAEIERLEQWKTEATKALTHWDHVAEPVVAGNAKYLGWFKWDAVAVELNRQDTEIERLRAHRDGMYQDRIEQAAEIERLRELVADAKTIITMTDFTSSTMDDLEHLWLKKQAGNS